MITDTTVSISASLARMVNTFPTGGRTSTTEFPTLQLGFTEAAHPAGMRKAFPHEVRKKTAESVATIFPYRDLLHPPLSDQVSLHGMSTLPNFVKTAFRFAALCTAVAITARPTDTANNSPAAISNSSHISFYRPTFGNSEAIGAGTEPDQFGTRFSESPTKSP